ncbi:MAG: HD domain-containing protein [Spirochaetaceae bacterium]|nr:MAG: HD domain-containing protein [Spirochaetaceae bacterium]
MRVKERVRWHLDHDYRNPIRDPLWSHIHLSDGLLAVVESVPFQQLGRIKQLGPAHLVYPGATHTRLAHSLGVYHIAHRMIRTLLSHDECPDLDLEAVVAYLCAALLHDLGHFPFTHSLKELPLDHHETLAARLIEQEPLASLIRDRVGVDPSFVAAIIDESIDDERDEVAFFRTLLSGALDPDKLDYLNRDAYFCGVPYGMQDIDFALSRIRPHSAHGIILEQSGISAVENVLFSKYLMYRAVYWHRNVRVATAMIKTGLYTALAEGLIPLDSLYGLTDETFYNGFASRDGRPFELIRRVHDRQLHIAVADAEYIESEPHHARLSDLAYRRGVEDRVRSLIAGTTGRAPDPEDVIIDVPEAVSFEVRFPVLSGDRIIDYPNAGTVFTPHVVGDFTRTLRRIRLMLSPAVADRCAQPQELIDAAIASN